MFDMIVITVRRGVPVGADTDAYKGFFTLPAQLVPSADRSPEHSISPVVAGARQAVLLVVGIRWVQ